MTEYEKSIIVSAMNRARVRAGYPALYDADAFDMVDYWLSLPWSVVERSGMNRKWYYASRDEICDELTHMQMEFYDDDIYRNAIQGVKNHLCDEEEDEYGSEAEEVQPRTEHERMRDFFFPKRGKLMSLKSWR